MQIQEACEAFRRPLEEQTARIAAAAAREFLAGKANI